MRRRDLLILGGATVAFPHAARAQQQAIPVIGFLGVSSPGTVAPFVAAFIRGVGSAGYTEGNNLAVEYRWAEAGYSGLPALAADLVERKVDLIFAAARPAALVAKSATSTIPIVFVSGDDPVAIGLVASFARPGSNLTGISLIGVELTPKRVDLLTELVPQARGVTLLVNPANSNAERIIDDAREAARLKGVQFQIVKSRTEAELAAAFATIGQSHDTALIVGNDPFFLSWHEQFAALASRHAVPTIYPWRDFADSGGLISYGPSLAEAYRQAGIYAGKILKGAKPAELPVQQPIKFEMIINLKTAKALGLAVPQSMLQRADEVIE